ncbi:hypothetical protein ACJX0J_042084, partial [Zea mays]
MGMYKKAHAVGSSSGPHYLVTVGNRKLFQLFALSSELLAVEINYMAKRENELQNDHMNLRTKDPRTCPTGHRPEDQPAGHQEHALQAAQSELKNCDKVILKNCSTFRARGGRAGAVGAELASWGGGAARSRWRSPLTAARRRRGPVAVTARRRRGPVAVTARAPGGGGAGSWRWRRGLPAVARWWRGELVREEERVRVGAWEET